MLCKYLPGSLNRLYMRHFYSGKLDFLNKLLKTWTGHNISGENSLMETRLFITLRNPCLTTTAPHYS